MYTFTLPSGTEVELRELTGVEEAVLANRNIKNFADKITKVLKACTVRIGDDAEITEAKIKDLLTLDRRFMLVMLRKVSLGSEFAFEVRCEACGKRNPASVDLDSLEVTPCQTDLTREFILPKTNQVVILSALTGHIEHRIGQLDEIDIHTMMLARIVTIDGKSPNKPAVTTLPAMDLAEIRKQATEMDSGGIDVKINGVCVRPSCGSPYEFDVTQSPDFLFPGLR